MVVHTVTVEEFEAMMLDGRIRDNCTLSAWGLYLLWKQKQEKLQQQKQQQMLQKK